MMSTLANIKPGTYVIKEIRGEYKKLYDLMIVPGTRITVITNDNEPMLVKIGNCKIAMGKDIARSIIVE